MIRRRLFAFLGASTAAIATTTVARVPSPTIREMSLDDLYPKPEVESIDPLQAAFDEGYAMPRYDRRKDKRAILKYTEDWSTLSPNFKRPIPHFDLVSPGSIA